MAKIRLFKKINLLHLFIIVLAVVSFLIYLFFSVNQYNQIDTLKSRQYFSLVQNELSQGNEPHTNGVDYAVISLDGVVQKSTIADYKVNQTIELKMLIGINGSTEKGRVYFAAPLLEDNTQVGTLVLLIDISLVRVGTSDVVWVILSACVCLGSVLLIVGTSIIIEKEIVTPLNTLNRIAKKMAGGDYSEKLLYDYSDEIGQLCHDIEILRDDILSAHKREIELKKNEKFLLACISHDLKTPLSVISGTAESLKDNMETTENAADTILNKIAMLNKLIDDILEQTKTELGEFSINISECYAKNFFETEMKDLQAQAEAKGLTFRSSPCPDCIISIDRQRVIQAMQNLISNAVKYTPKGGIITISFELKDNKLIISVKDTGAGIPAQDLPFIFDKFYRGEKARNSETSGSGLGLPIAKYIIEKHNSKIECDTLLGKGTEMRFSLPLDR